MPTIQNTSESPDTDNDNQAAIARQAIYDESRSVFGYELFDRSHTVGHHTAETDAALLFNALTVAETEALVGNKLVFINCTMDSLAGTHLELVHPDKVVLEVPPIAGDSPAEILGHVALLETLHRRGFRFAFNQTVLTTPYAPWLALAAFVKFDMVDLTPAQVPALLRYAQVNSSARVIAEKIETHEQYEALAKAGIKLFQGYWLAVPVLVKTQTVRPTQATILQLINLVRKEANVGEIEELLKKDPTLSFNLLRFINSSGFGLRVEITSFRHAVMILGLKKLFRWAALLMTTSRNGGTPPAIGQIAVVRGRLMELLAAESLPQDECDNAFVVGLFSMLEAMLGVPLAKALDSVALPQSVIDALLHGTGIFAPFLALTIACETGSEDVAAAAAVLKLSTKQVNKAHLQALTWAESLG